jgi:CheY-like chemotaxis protein
MSEAMILPPFTDGQTKRAPTVYFIDDSATMREVIKIAFRRENFNVITCADAASALAQFDQNPPDAVITDVIMPDTDGYSVCTQVKQHAQFGHIPVVLMSGVVNKAVADKAVSVKADELIRKPFQPQELIGRVKSLLTPNSATPAVHERPSSHSAPNALTSLFAPPTLAQSLAPNSLPSAPPQQAPDSAWPRALAEAFTPRPLFPTPSNSPGSTSDGSHHVSPSSALHQPGLASPSQHLGGFSPSHGSQSSPSHPADTPASQSVPHFGSHSSYPSQPTSTNSPFSSSVPTSAGQSSQNSSRPVAPDALKLRAEIARLELLIKKLQTELQIERQYNQALESQLHNLTHSD